MNRQGRLSGLFAAAVERLEPRQLLSDVYEPNNTLGTATNFGELGDREEFDLDIHSSGDQDFYRFTALGSGNVFIRINFFHLLGDLDMYLYGPSNTVVADSTGTSNTEEINFTVVEGLNYTINVAGFLGDTNTYDMLIDGPDSGSGTTPDRFESNDNFAAATNLGTLGDRTESDLNVHQTNNDDFFKFNAAANGSATMSISFTHIAGDLDLFMYDSSQLEIDSSEGVANTETITRSLTGGALYYLRVSGFDGDTSPQYSLSIDGQNVAAPSVSSSSFAFETRHQIQFNFDQDVSASVDLTDLTVTNLTSAQVIPSANFTLEVTTNAGLTTANWKANAPLPDGNYSAVLNGAGITNGSGTPISGTPTRDFFALAGDTNRDRLVDITDLGTLASNWQQSPRVFSQGDFNHDSMVDITDLGMLATNWQKNLPALGARPTARASARPVRMADLTLS